MNRILSALLMALCLSVTAVAGSDVDHRIDSLMNHLDNVIANRDMYFSMKENMLESKEHAAAKATSGRARFMILDELLDGYMAFNTDSAHSVSLRMEDIARKADDEEMKVNALLGRAKVYVAVGMYKEAVDLLGSMDPAYVPANLISEYYQVKHTAFGRLADYSVFQADKLRYAEFERSYSDSILATSDHNSPDYIITLAEKYNKNGSPSKAISLIEDHLRKNNIPNRERALYAWTLSESYALLGDHERQKEQLLISSISDLESAVREYLSLRQLAILLYDEGDMDRAHKFMTIAVDDAGKANARQRIVELNSSYPLINNIYLDTIRTQQRRLVWAVCIITVLTVFLCILLLCMRRQMKKIAVARRNVDEANRKLTELNGQLTAYNNRLTDANRQIAENSELKEVYISRYMEQCLIYIEKHDSFRITIGKNLSAGKVDIAKKLVKSTADIDEELAMFYESFDNTFLSLFPDFVSELNNLLMPGEGFQTKKDGMLSPELRICALIRLGISDSDKIAKFLRYSLTTIYNYRSRVRSKAACGKNNLEAEIMKIGRHKM